MAKSKEFFVAGNLNKPLVEMKMAIDLFCYCSLSSDMIHGELELMAKKNPSKLRLLGDGS